MQNTQASYPRVCTHESQSFLRNYWKLNRLSSNNCHRPLNTKNNIQSLHQPPHFSIRFKLFSQHLQIGNCSFIFVTIQDKKTVFLASSLWQVFVFTLLGSGKFVEKVCDEWVLSTSVCGTGSFSAHTATHSISGSAHETQTFSTDLRKQKRNYKHLPQTIS